MHNLVAFCGFCDVVQLLSQVSKLSTTPQKHYTYEAVILHPNTHILTIPNLLCVSTALHFMHISYKGTIKFMDILSAFFHLA